MTRRSASALLACCAICAGFAGTTSAQDLEPRIHFPDRALAYVEIDVPRLGAQLADTVLGKIVAHPAWQAVIARAMALVPPELLSGSDAFRNLTGKTPFELCELLAGRIAFTVRDVAPPAIVEAALAIRVDGGKQDELVGVLRRLEDFYEQESGFEVSSRRAGDWDARVWPTPIGPLYETVVGSTVLLVLSDTMLRSIQSSFAAKEKPAGANDSPLLKELAAPLAVADASVLFAVNLEGVRALTFPMLAMAGEAAAEARQLIRFSGATKLTSLGFAAGRAAGGGVELAAHLGMRDGPAGVFASIQGGLGKIEGVEAALARTPASATSAGALRIAPGKIAGEILRSLKDTFPQIAGDIDQALAEVESETGIDVTDDLLPLPEISLHFFSADPPAGSLFGDNLCLVRSSELEPYWRVAVELAKHFGIEPATLRVGDAAIESIVPLSGTAEDHPLAELFRGAIESAGPELGAVALLLPYGAACLARLDIGDGWHVVGLRAHAVQRYALAYGKGAKLDSRSELGKLAMQELPGSVCASVWQGKKSLLFAYNSLLALAEGLGPFAMAYGFDTYALPPGEAFLDHATPSRIQFSTGQGGWTMRCDPTFGGLGVVAAGGIVAGLAVPALLSGRQSAELLTCTNRLRAIQLVATQYAIEHGRYPSGAEGAAAALQTLVSPLADVEFAPSSFVCPSSGDSPCPIDSDGRVVLTDDCCSYTVVPWKIEPGDDAIWVYDEAPYHRGRRVVCLASGRVETLDEAEFQERLAAESEKHAESAEN